MTGSRIANIRAREILDSKGIPMVEVDVLTSSGAMGRGASSCGVSVGRHEAVVLRDGDERYQGLGVRKAIRHVMEIILPALRGMDVCRQESVDRTMIDLDGTPDKSRLGVNAVYSVSIAVARAAANSRGIPLFRHLHEAETYNLPVPVFNMVNGGTYGDRVVDFQEFHLLPTGADSYPEALRMGAEVFYRLPEVIAKRYGRGRLQIGKGAGWAAPVNDAGQAFEILLEAAEMAGYRDRVQVGLDCAASHIYDRAGGGYRIEGGTVSREELIERLIKLAEAYPLCLIEDPLDEDDFEGHAALAGRVSTLVTGDDLFATQLDRLKKGLVLGAANSIVIKPNMVGTITEALQTAAHAEAHDCRIIPGGRSGGYVDDPIPDMAVAAGATLVKFGAPRAGEKINKYNRLLQIKDELGRAAVFPGFPELPARKGKEDA